MAPDIDAGSLLLQPAYLVFHCSGLFLPDVGIPVGLAGTTDSDALSPKVLTLRGPSTATTVEPSIT